MRAALPITALVASLAMLTSVPARAACKQKGDRPQIFLKSKTAVRRGPGLNYPPSAMIDDGKCVTLSEVSLDEQWVLIEDDEKKMFGWVPASALDAASREMLGSAKGKSGPIGSGQERGYVATKASASLLQRPDSNGEVKKVLPPGSRLLALSMTEDGKWVEVRDERGETGWVGARGLKDENDTLAGLPRTTAGIKTGLGSGDDDRDNVVSSKSRKRSSDSDSEETHELRPARESKSDQRHIVPVDEEPMTQQTSRTPASHGLEIETRVLALAMLPRHGLDSNGQQAIRRYAVRAFAGGGHLEMIAAPLGSFRARLAYSFVLLTGLELKTDSKQSVGGQQHDAQLLLGYPIELGDVKLVPELGYAFSLFAMQPSFPGSNMPQFLSSHSHGANLGLALSIAFSESFALEAEAAGIFGTTIVYPFDVGASGGLTVGARAGAGIRIGIGGGAGIIAAWGLNYRQAPFSGKSMTDPTITSAKVTHVDNGVSLGIAFTL